MPTKIKKQLIRLLFCVVALLIYLIISSVLIYGKKTVTLNPQARSGYPLLIGTLKDEVAILKDDSGVYAINADRISSLGTAGGIHYYPVTIGLASIRDYQRFGRTGNESAREAVLANARWLYENQDASGAWLSTRGRSFGSMKLEPPWPSALSQGLGISVLLRAYRITGEKKFLNTAKRALNPMRSKVSEGGVLFVDEDGAFFEEYPISGHEPHVLNGAIYCLFGLYEFVRDTNNPEAKELFELGLRGLKQRLPDFNANVWSKYSLSPESSFRNHYRFASPWYQKIHIEQLLALYEITNDKFFLEYAHKFRKQHSGWFALLIYPAYVAYSDFSIAYKYFTSLAT